MHTTRRRRGIASLEVALSLPIIVMMGLILISLVWMGITRFRVAVASRYYAWEQRDRPIENERPFDYTNNFVFETRLPREYVQTERDTFRYKLAIQPNGMHFPEYAVASTSVISEGSPFDFRVAGFEEPEFDLGPFNFDVGDADLVVSHMDEFSKMGTGFNPSLISLHLDKLVQLQFMFARVRYFPD